MDAIRRGLVAGAFGTALLDMATYLDMVLTGRPASSVPKDAMSRVVDADDNRLEAYGALGGIATGLGIGVTASLVRSAGVRLPAPLGAVAIGGLAMAATDGPMAAGGISDPRDWSAADWTRDVVPHLAYGAGVRWAMDRIDEPEREPRRGLLARSLALGVASGARSSLGIGGPVLAARGGRAALVAAGLVGTELVVDKVPGVPSRLLPGPLAGRLVAGGVGAAALARADDKRPVLPAIVGVAGAALGSFGGAVWRDLAAERGWTWQAGAAEDAVALGLTVAACR